MSFISLHLVSTFHVRLKLCRHMSSLVLVSFICKKLNVHKLPRNKTFSWKLSSTVSYTSTLWSALKWYRYRYRKVHKCEWQKKMEQVWLNGSTFVRLDIYQLNVLFFTSDISFNINSGRVDHVKKTVTLRIQYFYFTK